MKYFKKDGNVYAFKLDGSQDKYITVDFVEMTEEEVYLHLNPKPTPEQLYQQAKAEKVLQVSKITVKTSNGNVFDGNEEAQNRLSRAVTASSAGEQTTWVLADNTAAHVTHEELKEALRLAGDAMTAIWTT